MPEAVEKENIDVRHCLLSARADSDIRDWPYESAFETGLEAERFRSGCKKDKGSRQDRFVRRVEEQDPTTSIEHSCDYVVTDATDPRTFTRHGLEEC